VARHFRAPAALSLGYQPLTGLPTEQKASWAPEKFSTLWKREQPLGLVGNQAVIRPSSSLYVGRDTLLALLSCCCCCVLDKLVGKFRRSHISQLVCTVRKRALVCLLVWQQASLCGLHGLKNLQYNAKYFRLPFLFCVWSELRTQGQTRGVIHTAVSVFVSSLVTKCVTLQFCCAVRCLIFSTLN